MPPKAKAKVAAAQASAEAAAAGVPVLSLCSSLGNSEFVPGIQLRSKECQCLIRHAEGQEQQNDQPADGAKQRQGQRRGRTAAAHRRAWDQWQVKLRSRGTGAMELDCCGLCSRAAVSTAPGKTSEMLDLIQQMGVTAFAEATRKPSSDLSPLLLMFSEEEKLRTESASSEVAMHDNPREALQTSGRRARLWLLAFALSFLNCGALRSESSTSQLSPRGPPGSTQSFATHDLADRADVVLCPAAQKYEWLELATVKESARRRRAMVGGSTDHGRVLLPTEDWSEYLESRRLS